jgi:hypothetical protein
VLLVLSISQDGPIEALLALWKHLLKVGDFPLGQTSGPIADTSFRVLARKRRRIVNFIASTLLVDIHRSRYLTFREIHPSMHREGGRISLPPSLGQIAEQFSVGKLDAALFFSIYGDNYGTDSFSGSIFVQLRC